MAQILTISQINAYIKDKIDNDALLGNVAVVGEISNYKLYPSGHHYFSLKDENSTIKCVLFRGNAMRLRFPLENGMRIIAMGRVSVYPRDGAYQLYCNAIALDGVGDLHAAFEQLKMKLEKQGLFALEHKKKLPLYPNVIGIVTSAAGAAIHDILRVIGKRYPVAKIRLFPVRVQGVEAPGEIAAAIRYANEHKLADLLIVGRGGGSVEDLWAFNDEKVAYAIYDSEIPVISAVGHEPDVTISDFVADVRAATPSNAAELAVPDKDALYQTLDKISATMASVLQSKLQASRLHLNLLAESPALQSPLRLIEGHRDSLYQLKDALLSVQTQFISKKKMRFVENAAKLDALSPLKVLSRGYAIAQLPTGKVLSSAKQACVGNTINVTLSDGKLLAEITEIKEMNHE